MKKVLILLVTMMLCACSPAEPMSLKDSYGQYKQEKIVYANKKDYIKKKDAYNAYLVYEINKDACTFESDLKYQNIQYKKVELSKDEKEKVPEALIKYNLYEGEKQLGIAVYLGEETVYILAMINMMAVLYILRKWKKSQIRVKIYEKQKINNFVYIR